VDILSNIFSEVPEKGCLHILVQRPPVGECEGFIVLPVGITDDTV
jgi:hypothetical protein